MVLIAALAVTFAARFPGGSATASSDAPLPAFTFSGAGGGSQAATATGLRATGTHKTRESIAAYNVQLAAAPVRAAGGVAPTASLTSGVSAAAAASGQPDAAIRPLADQVDPRRPFELYTTVPGDSVSGVAAKFGIAVGTLLDNNPTVTDANLLALGRQLVVPLRDGILHKVGHGETVASIVNQYDNITAGQVVAYRPNAITDRDNLETGRYVLLVGAARKPPPPPPPSRPGGGGAGPRPGGSGRFSYPLAGWHYVSDPFGVDRGGGRIHEGIDLALGAGANVPVYSACNGRVSRTEYLTYSYGYHVIVDCGDGWTTLYAHLSEIDVSPGQNVSAGTQLGLSGTTGFSTGEHLHFEIRINGAPVDPADYLAF